MRHRRKGRRRGGRVDVSFPAHVSVRGPNRIENLRMPVIDMSSTGLRLHSHTELPRNRMATIEATCDGESYTARGRIVRIEPADGGGWFVGVEFDPQVLEENPFPTSVLVVNHDMPEVLPPRSSASG